MVVNSLQEAIVKIVDGIAIIETAKSVGNGRFGDQLLQKADMNKRGVGKDDPPGDGIQEKLVAVEESRYSQYFLCQGQLHGIVDHSLQQTNRRY